jgi:hypothetical protein
MLNTSEHKHISCYTNRFRDSYNIVSYCRSSLLGYFYRWPTWGGAVCGNGSASLRNRNRLVAFLTGFCLVIHSMP